MAVERYKEKIYAGVLGKIIGVYLGRPIEGWSYEKICRTFGDVDYYKNFEIGVPLIVPDDDISGTFAFYRALEDNGYPRDISAAQIGNGWLNYIIKNKTILWWGGLGRSTEHTAYLRLLNGIRPPESGSIARNGRSIAEQIGAQIFIDSWALVNPDDAESAVRMAREAASVSHDGVAIDAACYWAAMESSAFSESNIDRLMNDSLRYVKNSTLLNLIQDVCELCEKQDDWRKVRDWIADVHGYDKYSGSCPIVTNHLVMLMALRYGRDDFQKSISIACSAGWDTDCNAGNVGCLNGIRLGLHGINAGADLRSIVADRLYVVTSDGGSCVSDAVLESRKIFKAAARLRDEVVAQAEERFVFEFPGSFQGWGVHPSCLMNPAHGRLANEDGKQGLVLHYSNLARGVSAAYSVETFPGQKSSGRDGTSYFEVLSSPTLYPTQKIHVVIRSDQCANPQLRFFVEYLSCDGAVENNFSPQYPILHGRNEFDWVVPKLNSQAIFRFGVELTSSNRLDGELHLISVDWGDAPIAYRLGRSIELSPDLTPWTTETMWLKTFMSSAEQFFPDFATTFSISHPKENGVVTTGTMDWKDYAVESRITFSQNEGAGIVARAKGHRRYYAAMIKNGVAMIAIRKDEILNPIVSIPFNCATDSTHLLRFEVRESCLRFMIDSVDLLTCEDGSYARGGAGFIVASGAILAEGFLIERL